jgi:hypothetical protein
MDSISPSSANPILDPSASRAPVLAGISLSPLPVEINMQKLVGVLFARLNAVEHTLHTRLDAFGKRLDALETALKTPTT